MRIFLLTCDNGDELCVLADGGRVEAVATAEHDMTDDPVAPTAQRLAAFFGVNLERRDVPGHVTANDEWAFDDSLAWLRGTLTPP